MDSIASTLIEQVNDNLLSIATFLACVAWLCQQNGWIRAVTLWYTERTTDNHKIVVPALATLVLPFVVPAFTRLVQPFWHQTTSYLIPSVTTLSTFVLAQYLLEKRELIKAEKVTQKVRNQVVSYIYLDFSVAQKYYRENKLNTPDHFLIERDDILRSQTPKNLRWQHTRYD